MLISLALLVSSLVIYFELIQPAYDDVKKVRGERASQQALLDAEKATIKQVQNLIGVYDSQSKAQETISSVLPLTDDAAGALVQLYGLAQNSNLALQGISVSVSGVQSVPASASDSQTAQAQVNPQDFLRKPIGTVTLQLKVNSSYEAFKNFLSLVETNIRIFDVKSLGIQPPPPAATGKAGPGQNLYGFDLTVATYYQSP